MQATPLQMANIAAAIANKGHYYTPHLVKAIGDSTLNYKKTKKKTLVNPEYFDIVHEGMQWVIEESGGTARRARIDSLHYCGKTGTSQNPHGEDHSIFMCFAPRENPKIAMVVFVENGGKGGATSAPIASLLVEKYLYKTIKRIATEEYVLNLKLY